MTVTNLRGRAAPARTIGGRVMAIHTITAKNINALAGNEYPETWRVSDALRRVITRLETRIGSWLRYRDTVNELGDLTDRQLEDLGILRSQIEPVARAAAYRLDV
jgi:uncharacterized protein YjiS (DUF1127 family)